MAKIALIRIRGLVDLKFEIKDTLNFLNLFRRNYCVVVENTDSNMGMIKKVKDYVTYGEIDDSTYKLLLEKKLEKNPDGSSKKFFRLHPPRGGFERKGIKIPFSQKGALGYRGSKINDLIKKML
jgi:large subunit ribosomal protein L30